MEIPIPVSAERRRWVWHFVVIFLDAQSIIPRSTRSHIHIDFASLIIPLDSSRPSLSLPPRLNVAKIKVNGRHSPEIMLRTGLSDNRIKSHKFPENKAIFLFLAAHPSNRQFQITLSLIACCWHFSEYLLFPIHHSHITEFMCVIYKHANCKSLAHCFTCTLFNIKNVCVSAATASENQQIIERKHTETHWRDANRSLSMCNISFIPNFSKANNSNSESICMALCYLFAGLLDVGSFSLLFYISRTRTRKKRYFMAFAFF